MRLTRALLLAFALLAPGLASAQDYQWIDERGGIHFASDPSEVPGRYREKAVRDALKRAQAKPAAPAAPARAAEAEAEAAPKYKDPHRISDEQMKRKDQSRRAVRGADSDARHAAERRREMNAEEEKEAQEEAIRQKRDADREAGKVGTPDGFHRECTRVEKRGEMVEECHDVEDDARAGGRMERATEKAKEDLGITDEDIQKDPEAREALQKRAMRNYQRSAPGAASQGEDDDEGADDSDSDVEDEP